MNEPFVWMGQTLAFVMMATVLSLWNQLSGLVKTDLLNKKDWDPLILALSFQAAARFFGSVSDLLDPMFKHQGAPMAPFYILSVVLGGVSLFIIPPLLPLSESWTVHYKSMIHKNGLVLCLRVLALMISLMLGVSLAIYLNLISAMIVLSLSLTFKRLKRETDISLNTNAGLWIGSLYLLISVWGQIGLWGCLMLSILLSLMGLKLVHEKIESISHGVIPLSLKGTLAYGIGAWGILIGLPIGLILITRNESHASYYYLMEMSLLCALFVVSWRYRAISVAVTDYLGEMSRTQSKNLLIGIDAAAFLLDAEGGIQEVSKEAELLMKEDESSLKNKNIWSLLGVPPMLKEGRFEQKDKYYRDLMITVAVVGRSEDHRWILTVRDVSHEKAVQKALDKAEKEDELTGLPNRREALLMVDQAIQSGETLGVLFLDLDHFKNVNDTEGHAAGDALLREVADLLSMSLKESGGWLARIGGDEFLGILPNTSEELCREAACRCIGSMDLSTRASKWSVGVSVGVALYPRDGETSMDLIRRADSAMYESKIKGRGNISFFGEEIEKKLRRRVLVESFLKDALKKDQGLTLFLQPICHTDGRFEGWVEALIRPEGFPGLNAQELIDVAELSGLIMPLGRWVLKKAIKIQKEFQEHSLLLDVSINVSAKQFMDDLFWQDLRNLHQTGQDLTRLTLEVTESTLMEDTKRAVDYLKEMQRYGVKIALDDFGAGYSALSVLKVMPLDKIKIDKSLMDNITDRPESAKVAQAAIAMANALELCIIAEGIERSDQSRWLEERNVEWVQGYWFSKPLKVDQLLSKMLEKKGHCAGWPDPQKEHEIWLNKNHIKDETPNLPNHDNLKIVET